MKRESSHEDFVKTFKSAPQGLVELLNQKFIGVLDFSNKDTKNLLTWTLAAERLLTVTEIKNLLLLDLQNQKLTADQINTTDIVKRSCGSLVTIKNGSSQASICLQQAFHHVEARAPIRSPV